MNGHFKLVPPHKLTVVESIVEQIVSQIKDGTLKPGDRLPSERQLIEMLGVSRSSVREALQGLAAMGLVEIRHGEGSFVNAPPASAALNQPIDIHPLALQKEMRVQLNQARLILETGIVKEAAARITDAGREQLMQAYRNCYQDHFTYSKKIDWQTHDRIHLTLAEATGNRFLVQIVQSLLDLVPPSLREGGLLQGTPDELSSTFLADKDIHRGLCEAVIEGDVGRAIDWLHQHAEQEDQVIERYYGAIETQFEAA